ncbi:6024_t:CDS:2, partial [Paraglomus occultum]
TARHLQKISSSVNIRGFELGLEVYVVSFNSGIDVANGVSRFWESFALKMQAVYPNRFSFDQNQSVTSAVFESFFRRTASSLPVVLLIDEGSFLVNCDVAIVDDFTGILCLLRDGHLLVPRQLPKSIGRISPFTREATIIPGRFIEADIQMLLDEYMNEASIELDSAAFAQDIYQRTLGHKGLVGTCCAAIEKKIALGKHSVSIDEWELYAVANLLRYVCEQDTYASIIQALRQLSEKQREIVGLTLHYGSVVVKECDELKFLLAEGIVRVQENQEVSQIAPVHMIIECAAPLLRSIMISQLCGPEIEIGLAPDPHKVCPQWLIARTIENLGIQHIFAKQTLNADGQPSEYAFQVEVAAIFKQLLSKAYPTLMYHVLPEAKEYDEDSTRCKQLDILVHNINSGFPAYGYELLVNANKDIFNKHCEQAYNYGRIHQCSMMVVHFSESGKLAMYFGPNYENVTVMHVVYDAMQNNARLIYQDGEELVHIKGIDWKVMFI